MTSNVKLIEEITTIAIEKSVDMPETEGLKNCELIDALDDLKNLSSSVTYVVNKGKALTSKRGILGEGIEIFAKDLAGGDEAIASFVKSGHIIVK